MHSCSSFITSSCVIPRIPDSSTCRNNHHWIKNKIHIQVFKIRGSVEVMFVPSQVDSHINLSMFYCSTGLSSSNQSSLLPSCHYWLVMQCSSLTGGWCIEPKTLLCSILCTVVQPASTGFEDNCWLRLVTAVSRVTEAPSADWSLPRSFNAPTVHFQTLSADHLHKHNQETQSTSDTEDNHNSTRLPMMILESSLSCRVHFTRSSVHRVQYDQKYGTRVCICVWFSVVSLFADHVCS